MPRFVIVAIIAIVLSVTMQQAFALKCWQCVGKDDPYCNEPFDGSKLGGNWNHYVECVPEPNQEAQCLIVTVGDRFARGCARSSQLLTSEGERFISILKPVAKNPEATEYHGCKTDGCNGASQYGPVAVMIAIPVIIMRVASL